MLVLISDFCCNKIIYNKTHCFFYFNFKLFYYIFNRKYYYNNHYWVIDWLWPGPLMIYFIVFILGLYEACKVRLMWEYREFRLHNKECKLHNEVYKVRRRIHDDINLLLHPTGTPFEQFKLFPFHTTRVQYSFKCASRRYPSLHGLSFALSLFVK